MKKSYAELLSEIDALQREAEAVRQTEIQGVIERIKEAIAAYHLTAEDLGLAPARPQLHTSNAPRNKRSRAPKYSDGAGNVWSGRGPRPRWLKEALNKGARLEQFSTAQH